VVFPGYDSTIGKPTQGAAVCPTPAAVIVATGVPRVVVGDAASEKE